MFEDHWMHKTANLLVSRTANPTAVTSHLFDVSSKEKARGFGPPLGPPNQRHSTTVLECAPARYQVAHFWEARLHRIRHQKSTIHSDYMTHSARLFSSAGFTEPPLVITSDGFCPGFLHCGRPGQTHPPVLGFLLDTTAGWRVFLDLSDQFDPAALLVSRRSQW